MINQNRLFRISTLLLAGCLAGILQGYAGPGAVLAPVVEVKGAPSLVNPGGSKLPLRTGESLAEGSVITTGSDSGVMLAPVPGVAITVAKNTSVAVLHLGVKKNGDIVSKRDVQLRLDRGTLAFSLEKRDAAKTSLVVETLRGTMLARGAVGTIAVIGPCVKVATVSGKVTFVPNGTSVARSSIPGARAAGSTALESNSSEIATRLPIVVKPGSFLVVCGEGEDLEIHMVDALAKTWTNFNADGTQLSTRAATVQELESGRGFFETAFAHASAAVGYGLLSSEGAAEVADMLARINQSYASVGLKPLQPPFDLDEVRAYGGSKRGRGSNLGLTPQGPGFLGGSINPANTGGEVNSPEQ